MTNRMYPAGIGALLLCATALMPASHASAQGVSLSLGPQVTTLGVGVAATARTGKLGISAGYNLFPLSKTDKSAFKNTLVIEPVLQGGLLMVTFHPTDGKFALGAGLQMGGASADALMRLDPNGSGTLEIGNSEYLARDVGDLTGRFDYGSSLQPAFLLGWIGSGFNFALGAAIATPELTLEASGPLKNDSAFKADLERQISDFDDEAGQIPVFPYVRLGWQFSF